MTMVEKCYGFAAFFLLYLASLSVVDFEIFCNLCVLYKRGR